MPARSLAQGADWKPRILALLVVLLIAATLLVKLDQAPALWWDEGWTLSVARNWVEQGFYGRLLDGQPYSPALAGHFTVVASVALSFKLFGVGVWQGRLPGVLYALGAMGLMFAFARRLYPKPVAWGMLFVMTLTPIATNLNPIIIGRQVLGEMPSLFLLLAGFAFMTAALERSAWWGLGAAFCWGMAVVTKAQVMPFWLASAGLMLAIAVYKRWWRAAILVILMVAGSFLVSRMIYPRIYAALIGGTTVVQSGGSIEGLVNTFAVVTDWSVRVMALIVVLVFGILPLLGIVTESWLALKDIRKSGQRPAPGLLRWGLLGLAGSWMVWYIGLAMYFPRYLFPASFLGSIFAAAMLYNLTNGYDLRRTAKQASAFIAYFRGKHKDGTSLLICLRSLALVILVLASFLLTLINLQILFYPRNPYTPQDVAVYLMQNTSPTDLIETYESELLFLTDRRFHFPPDQVSVDSIRHSLNEPTFGVHYDALQADPDYLVVGPYASEWRIYTPWLENGDFQLIKDFGLYQLFARRR